MAGMAKAAEPATLAYKDAAFTEFFRRTNGLVAGDGGISVPLSDGAVLWLFGDSHIDDLNPTNGTLPCLFQVRNAALLQQSNGTTTLISGNPRGSFIRTATDEKLWFWPQAGFQSTGGTIYIYTMKLQRAGKGGGMFDFRAVSRHWAKIERSDLAGSADGNMESVPVTFSRLQNFRDIEFGCGFSQEADGYTYTFGVKAGKKDNNICVARFLSIRPEGRWTFWDGKRWTAAVSQAKAIGYGASTSLSVCKVNGRWLALSSAFSIACDQGKAIYASVSTNLTGPFSPPQKIYEIDDVVDGHYPFFYLPEAHPESVNSKNEILVTYSINGYDPCFPTCKDGRMNPDYYRVKAIRLPLSLVGIP